MFLHEDENLNEAVIHYFLSDVLNISIILAKYVLIDTNNNLTLITINDSNITYNFISKRAYYSLLKLISCIKF